MGGFVLQLPRSRERIVRRFLVVFSWLAAMVCASADAVSVKPRFNWLRSDVAAFEQARAEHRLVLLYLEAVWCHWCHVMDEKTYGDAEVTDEIARHYVPLRIDQDARPDLSTRYRDYGWPATILFAADGTELVKRQGYIPAEDFLATLKSTAADPTPQTAPPTRANSSGPAGALTKETRAELLRRYDTTFDSEQGGLTTAQKFLDRDSVEYALIAAANGDENEAGKAKKTLDAARNLMDPVWGGVYQYSTRGDWNHPHYEKLALVQASYLRMYALAWAQWHRPADRNAVERIRQYVNTFLRDPAGAIYTSQDADVVPGEHAENYFALNDAQRRHRGIPRIDQHLYTLQNGQWIEALATWSEVSGDSKALADARAAAQWVLAHRTLPSGGFRHDEKDAAGPYLGDTLAMGRAFLALYRVTAERTWLVRADEAADFIDHHFKDSGAGFVSARTNGPIAAVPHVEENISLARFANLLARYSGKPRHRAIAEYAEHYLSQPAVALATITEPGVLLVADELAQEPLHLTVVGAKDAPEAAKLFDAVQRLPGWYKRVEWWDRKEGPLPNADVPYPPVKRPAAFVCTENRCSLPIFDPAQIADFLDAEARSP